MKRNLVLYTVLAIMTIALAGARKKGAAPESPQLVTKDEVIYYPSGWKVDNPADVNIKVNITFYYRHATVRGPMPPESFNWAEVNLHRYKLKDIDTCRADVADFVADKNCAVKKCDLRSRDCPVHSKGLAVPSSLTRSCPGATMPDPGLTGGSCGRYYKRENYRGTFYYYFDRYENTGEGTPQMAEITVVFTRKNYLYLAELHTSAARAKNYLGHLEFIARSVSLR